MRTFNNPKEILENTKIMDRFISYVKVDTQADEECPDCPSTKKQLDLGKILVAELKSLGLDNANMDENGYVTAELKGNAKGMVGLCAHMDTAPAYSGTNVNPQFHKNYDGKPIKLKADVVIDPKNCPELEKSIGDTIITSDGTTLLGADDKAGIAAIMATIEMLKADPKIKFPTLRICFNPDEEIGRGAIKFPFETFRSPVAFTIDGGFPGELNVETFSADKGIVTFKGVSVHPGYAKGKMVNALTYMGKFLSRLPMAETPECTEKREGFYHPTDISGDAAECKCNLIIRDFKLDILKERGERLKKIGAALMAEEPKLKVTVEIQEQYRNMYDELSKHPEITRNLAKAVEMTGLEPNNEPIRGGTDGSRLTAMGMPTPNLFAGGVNFHGPQEWISDKSLALAACTILNLVQIYGESK
ncbi:MAG: peptidase T [Planctomycetota bacterium]